MSRVIPEPPPYGPIPSPRQLAWHKMEYYGFIHFTTNTFTDKEWGYGDESPAVFQPTALDARQWAQVARDAGMTGLILTCKHHDGFCLWPSRYTEHSVKSSPWREGRGDVVRELAEACEELGLRFGVYLSPWDRNHPAYGSPEYVSYYRRQLRELLTQYGPVFEVWFDGANGGDGYYGGAREKRLIDRATYYDWRRTWDMVRELQPEAVMFSDVGPDVRWVGNESGVAAQTTWYTLNTEGRYPGYSYPGYQPFADLGPGHEDGHQWVAPEVDVSIRPGWFYHASQDGEVKSPRRLLEIYYQSIGRGANLLLNVPPDRRGLFHEQDVENLLALRRLLTGIFQTNLARGARAVATNVRGGCANYAPDNVIDEHPDTFWATDDDVLQASMELVFPHPVRFDHVLLQEPIALGQRIRGWVLEAEVGGTWQQVTAGTTVGYKRLAVVKAITATRVRLSIRDAKACPTLSNFALYLAPEGLA